jgi:hypothetical protein
MPSLTLAALSEPVISAASDLTIALVSAGAAVVGAIVGGLISGVVTMRSETRKESFVRDQDEKRIQREEMQELAVARGAARIMRAHFDEAANVVRIANTRREWWPEGTPFEPLPPLEDRKLMASLLTADEWEDVQRAEFQFAVLTTRRQRFAASHSSVARVSYDDESHQAMKTALEYMERAIESLARLAGSPRESPFR